MNRVAILITILLFCLFLSSGRLMAQDSLQTKVPKIVFSENSFNFGNVPADTVVEHIFNFKNVGTDSLRIFRLTSG